MANDNPFDLILKNELSESQAASFLAPVGFSDWRVASRALRHLAVGPGTGEALVDLLPHLLAVLSLSASPDRVMVSLERFIWSSPDALQALRYLGANPRALEILVKLFAGSQFLTEILLRNPEYFERLVALKHLAQVKRPEQFVREAHTALDNHHAPEDQANAIRRYQRWELLRIGACDLLDLFDLITVTGQLSSLADSLVQTCLEVAIQQTGIAPTGFTVLGLGKLGGSELNYSSDIDLLFIASADASQYTRLAERFIEILAGVSEEGFLYRVDMRLRPWGSVGALVSSLEGYLVYLEKHAQLWEKQTLLKVRPLAGDQALGEAFLRRIEPLVFQHEPEVVRLSVYDMKQRTEMQLRLRGRGWGEVKLGEGSIRDIEFVLQYLQLAYGCKQPSIRSRNTLDGLEKLHHASLLTASEYQILSSGYVFLRTIEHYLQMMHYRQTHNLPDDTEALEYLARRLGFSGKSAGELFLARYLEHCTAIRAIYLRYVGSVKMDKVESQDLNKDNGPLGTVRKHIERMDPIYEATFSPAEIQHHAVLASLLEKDHLVEVETELLEDGNWRITIVAFDYLGELSLICGLMFVYGLNILNGEVFTYGSLQDAKTSTQPEEIRKKIVDVFVVHPEHQEPDPLFWQQYSQDLAALLQLLDTGQRRESRSEVAKRVALTLQENAPEMTPLYPIDIAIDNDSSPRYTLLYIESVDTIGFLYELTNALSFQHVYIAQMNIQSIGNRVRDTLYVTDDHEQKIISPEKQRELRTAIVLTKHFTHLLPHSPNPVSALLHFREFIDQLFTRPNWPDELASLERPEVLGGLARLLGVSDFLWDDFLRMQYANLFPVVSDLDALHTAKSRPRLQAELEAALLPVHKGPQPPRDDAPWQQVVNAFKDREMLRIDMRHILGHTQEFWEFSEELTDLVEVVVNAAYHLSAEDLRSVYGPPSLEDGSPSQMAVLALGKCGGRELGYASDIELMFVYTGNGLTKGPEVITSAEFHEKVVQSFVRAIHAKREGIFQVDLQLRPYGKTGSMAVSQEAFRRYFAPGGPAWAYERQALVKLRPIAGDEILGAQIAALRDEFIYTGEPFDIPAMHAMRERQIRHLVTAGTFNPKFSPGGMVDLEYLVQGLQITNGHRFPSLRVTNTRQAMAALAEVGILTSEDYTHLRKAYTFQRWLIDSLRVVRGNAKEITLPPADSEEFAFLARRLRYGSDLSKLKDDLALHTSNVREINARLLK